MNKQAYFRMMGLEKKALVETLIEPPTPEQIRFVKMFSPAALLQALKRRRKILEAGGPDPWFAPPIGLGEWQKDNQKFRPPLR